MKLHFISILLLSILVSGCITSPVVINKMKIDDRESKLSASVLLLTDKQFLSYMHQEKQLGTTFEYDLGFYLKNAVSDSLNTIFTHVTQSESLGSQNNYDLVIQPTLVNFTAPVPALVLMNTQTQVTIKYKVISKTPLRSYELLSTGTYELLNQEDEAIYNSLTSRDIYTYNAAANFGMHVPDYSYEAGKDAYMAIYHALIDLNQQLLSKIESSS